VASRRGSRGRLHVGRVILDVVRVYRRHWTLLVPMAVVVLLPQTLVDTAVGPLEAHRIETWTDVAKLAVLPLGVFASLVGEAFYAGLVAAAVLEWRAGRRLPRPSALAHVIPYRRLIASDLLLAIGAAIGFLLLVVPGVIFLTYFFIAPAVVKLEGLGVRDAFRRSATLVRGSFWRVLAIGLVALLGTELAAEGLAHLVHGLALDLAAQIAVDAALEPLQGLVTVLVALSLIELRGEGEDSGLPAQQLTS
jgi:hypothetical protein